MRRPTDSGLEARYVAAMQPDSSTPSQQGTGNPKTDKTGKTVPLDEIPPEHRREEGIDEGPTEGALPGEATEPLYRHLEPRPVREINRGAHS